MVFNSIISPRESLNTNTPNFKSSGFKVNKLVQKESFKIFRNKLKESLTTVVSALPTGS